MNVCGANSDQPGHLPTLISLHCRLSGLLDLNFLHVDLGLLVMHSHIVKFSHDADNAAHILAAT